MFSVKVKVSEPVFFIVKLFKKFLVFYDVQYGILFLTGRNKSIQQSSVTKMNSVKTSDRNSASLLKIR